MFYILVKQKLQQQQSQLMQNLNPQLYTQLNIGGLSSNILKSWDLFKKKIEYLFYYFINSPFD